MIQHARHLRRNGKREDQDLCKRATGKRSTRVTGIRTKALFRLDLFFCLQREAGRRIEDYHAAGALHCSKTQS